MPFHLRTAFHPSTDTGRASAPLAVLAGVAVAAVAVLALWLVSKETAPKTPLVAGPTAAPTMTAAPETTAPAVTTVGPRDRRIPPVDVAMARAGEQLSLLTEPPDADDRVRGPFVATGGSEMETPLRSRLLTETPRGAYWAKVDRSGAVCLLVHLPENPGEPVAASTCTALATFAERGLELAVGRIGAPSLTARLIPDSFPGIAPEGWRLVHPNLLVRA